MGASFAPRAYGNPEHGALLSQLRSGFVVSSLGSADDVRRDASRHEAGYEADSSTRDDVEAGPFDRREGGTVRVATSAAQGPEDVDGALQARKTRRLGADVFIEPQLAAGSDDAAKLGEGTALVRDGTENE